MSGTSLKTACPVGGNFSLANLLSPIPCEHFHIVSNIFSLVDKDLATPILKVALQVVGVHVTTEEVENVIWKFGEYLPGCLTLQHPLGQLPASLKKLQALSEEITLVRIAAECTHCNFCKDSPDLVPCPAVDRANINHNFKEALLLENRYRLFSYGAGVQNAAFQESKCQQCHAYFCGGWRYWKGSYGRLSRLTFHPEIAPQDLFVVPKLRSWYAVDHQLIQHITAELLHGGSSFSAAVQVWASQHKEKVQHSIIHGEDYTRVDSTRESLEVAWFAWQVLWRGGAKVQQMDWTFTDDGFEEMMIKCRQPLREHNLKLIAKHVEKCPRCQQCLLILTDGKQGARRFICAGLEGKVAFEDFNVSLATGCLRHAHPKDFFCRFCRPKKLTQVSLIPQTSVVGVETLDAAAGMQSEMRYLVDCYDPDTGDTFQALLPRSEVRADLLQSYETSLLPGQKEHRNKKALAPWLKGPHQKVRFLRKMQGACRVSPKATLSSKKAAESSSATPKTTNNKARAKATSSNKKATESSKAIPKTTNQKARAKASEHQKVTPAVATAWLSDAGSVASPCGIDKQQESKKRRRCTGGVVTAVTTCGLLIDWLELWRGESVELVYLFLLQLYKDLHALEVLVRAIGYDNACKLRSLALAKADACKPWTEAFAKDVAMILDRFHKKNHTWCLKNMPEVDPSNPANAPLVAGKNTEACEELNSWISVRTRCSLEMSEGRFGVYWCVQFEEHNKWLEEQVQAKRRRYALGALSRDPDAPQSSRTAS